MKSGSLNFLEPSGPVQACNGTDLPFNYLPSNMVSHYSNIICRYCSFLFISQYKKVNFKIHIKQQMYTDVTLCDIPFCGRHVKPKIHVTSVTIILAVNSKITLIWLTKYLKWLARSYEHYFGHWSEVTSMQDYIQDVSIFGSPPSTVNDVQRNVARSTSASRHYYWWLCVDANDDWLPDLMCGWPCIVIQCG